MGQDPSNSPRCCCSTPQIFLHKSHWELQYDIFSYTYVRNSWNVTKRSSLPPLITIQVPCSSIIFNMTHLLFVEYYIVDCFNISPFDLYFNSSGNICPMIFWFVDNSIYYTLIIIKFPKNFCCGLLFSLTIVHVVHCGCFLNWGKHTFWVTGINALPHMVS